MENTVLKLSELAKRISAAVTAHFSSQRYWVMAEIIGLKVNRGHCYLQVAEKDEIGAIPKAEFRAIIWASQFSWMHQRFLKETGSPLSENTRVLIQVEVQFHERYGLNLIIHDLDSSYTLGQIEMERRKTIERLRKEGVYHLNKECELPCVVQRIAVISASDSQGFKDFVTKLQYNSRGYTFYVDLYPALLQGDMAAGDIVTKLLAIRNDHSRKKFDAVIIVRGGGGASSLECFNNYQLAYAIATFPLPVITGIGHTSNRSVCDEVAHLDLITPTDTAVFIFNLNERFEESINHLNDHICELATDYLETERENLVSAANTVVNASGMKIGNGQNALQSHSWRMRHIATQAVNTEVLDVNNFRSLLQSTITGINIKESGRLDVLDERIRLLDPVQVLRRGFTYTIKSGSVLSDVNNLKSGEIIQTIFASGSVQSEIKTINYGGTEV